MLRHYCLCPQSTHSVAIAAFWRTFHHDGKISPAWWGWEVHASPPSFTISAITYRVVVSYAPAERAVICSSYFYSSPTCNLCLCQYSNECNVAKFIVPDCMGDIVDTGIGLLWRPARLLFTFKRIFAYKYSHTSKYSLYPPSQRLRIWPLVTSWELMWCDGCRGGADLLTFPLTRGWL